MLINGVYSRKNKCFTLQIVDITLKTIPELWNVLWSSDFHLRRSIRYIIKYFIIDTINISIGNHNGDINVYKNRKFSKKITQFRHFFWKKRFSSFFRTL